MKTIISWLLLACVAWAGSVETPDDVITTTSDSLPQETFTFTAPCDLNNMTSGDCPPASISKLPLPLLETDFPMASGYLVVLSVTMITGVFGNGAIILATFVYPKLRYSGHEFLLNLAIADLCVAAIAEPMCAVGIIKGRQWFEDRPELCVIIASFCLAACFCAFFSLAAMTVNRVVYVYWREYYGFLFTRPRIIFSVIVIWILAIGFEIPNFFGWGGHYFDDKNHQCIWNRTASVSYTFFVALFLIATPLVMMLLTYLCMLIRVIRSKASLRKHNDASKIATLRETLRSCRTLLIIVIAFIICWTPYAVIICLDTANELPTWAHLWATLLAHTHSSLNFFIYLAYNPLYRNGFGMLFCQKQIESPPTSKE